MFEGFSDEARSVVGASQAQARLLGHHATGTAHLLLGLLAEPAHLGRGAGEDVGAAGALAAAGVTLDGLRAQYAEHSVDHELHSTPASDRVLSGGSGGPGLPGTGNAKKVFELALRRALQLGGAPAASGRRQLITPAHLLLGVLDLRQSTGYQLLLQTGVNTVWLIGEAERAAATAPLITQPTAQEARIENDVARTPTPDDGGVVFSIFGWPSRLRLDGPAARQVLAEAKDSGDFNTERLLAAAEADAADRSPRADSTEGE